MNAPTDWIAPIAILAGGLILGLLFVYFFGRRKASAPLIGSDRDLELKDLEAKRDALIAQLRDLETDTKLTPDQLAQERRRLELETAGVLKSLDAYKGVRAPKGSAAAAPAVVEDDVEVESGPAMNPAIKGFLWGVGSVALIATLGYFVWKAATPKEQGMMAGGQPAAMGGQQAQTNPMVQQLEEMVKKNPDDLALRTNLAQAYLEVNNLMGVFRETQYVLERKPTDSRALTFGALVRMAMGEQTAALQMLDEAIKSDPKNVDGWLALAWVQTQKKETAKADETIAKAVAAVPEGKAQIEATYAEMKAAAAGAPAQSAAMNGEMPEGHPAIDGQPVNAAPQGMTPSQAAVQAAGGAAPIHLTLDLDPAAKSRVSPGAVLFVIARPAPGAPPIAAKRIALGALPMKLDFSSADSMMGQPLPAQVRIEARLDADGDAASKNPNDPKAAADGATAGSSINLVLK